MTIKITPYLLVTLLLLAPVQNTEAALMRNVIGSCAFGASVMAAAVYTGLTPGLSTGIFAIPVSEVILANAIIGCGVGAVGATTATVADWFYDVVF